MRVAVRAARQAYGTHSPPRPLEVDAAGSGLVDLFMPQMMMATHAGKADMITHQAEGWPHSAGRAFVDP